MAGFSKIEASFDSFDTFSSTMNKVLRDGTVKKVSPGPFTAKYVELSSSSIKLTLTSTSSPIIREGHTPEGVWMFGIFDSPGEFYWCGYKATAKNGLGLFPSEVLAAPTTALDAYGMAFTDESVATVANLAEIRLTRSGSSNRIGKQVCRDPVRIQNLKNQLKSILEATGSNQDDVDELLASLLRLYLEPGETSKPGNNSRRRALNSALDYIEAYAPEELTIRDICLNVGVSSRTLSYAFQEHLGLSPKKYLMCHRLNGFRRALSRADKSSVRVSALANEWGFWHMGKLAGDYKSLFGSLPRDDLKRSHQIWQVRN